MHPFTAAKFVSSYVQMSGRKVYLNMITGTALNYLEAMKDAVSHDERYDRLGEYIVLMQRLLDSTSPVTLNGKYYQVRDLSLLPACRPACGRSFCSQANPTRHAGSWRRWVPSGLRCSVRNSRED